MTKSILGIIGAMEEEVKELTSMLENKIEYKIANMVFNVGYIYGKKLVIVHCGIAKVNAAMCTQILISEFGVNSIINTGVAGALFEKLKINDIVISSDAIEYDVDASAMGDPKGTIPRMETSVFEADKNLINLAKISFENQDLDSNLYIGRILTGDRFVAELEFKKYLIEMFKGYCCEMEGAAIAHVAHLNKIPFLIIRSISDNADNKAEMAYPEFVKIAAETSKNIVLGIIKNI